MQRLSYTGRQDEEFYRTGKYSQITDLEYWSFCIEYRSVFTVEHVIFFPCRTGYSVMMTPASCNPTTLKKCVNGGST